ncbi:MAG TPA: L,D-transpeptidase [bacterium]|nr:L,D-transpeptidase [bacterium]
MSLLTLLSLLGAVPRAGAGSRYGEILCTQKGYECLEVDAGDTWEILWPDDYERDLVRRANRMNVKLRPGMILAVPKKLERATVMSVSPFPKKRDTDGEKLVVVDLSQLAWGAYDEDGKLVFWGPASGGKNWCPDVRSRCRSPDGEFSALSKGGRKCKSGKFPIGKGGAPMPYCMFFRRGYALHGSPEVPGYNASHGCVRLFTEDALWLNEFFVETPSKENDFHGTRVLVLPYEDAIPIP